MTHRQLTAYFDPEERLAIAREFVLSAVHNIRLNLHYHKKHSKNDRYDQAIAAINSLRAQINSCDTYDHLLGFEASVHKVYYSCFDIMIKPENMVFDKRSRRPPRNEVNAIISYGNTVLYSLIAFGINKSPLDIRIGYLHATNGFRTESLNLDLAEVFKPLIVDRILFSLCNLHSIRPEHFEKEENGGVYLTHTGKKIFLRALYDKLDEGLTIDGRYFTYNMLIEEEIRKLVRYFRNREPYIAYRQVQ